MSNTTPRTPRTKKPVEQSQVEAKPKAARKKTPAKAQETKQLVPPRRSKPAANARHLAAVPDAGADAGAQLKPPPNPPDDMGPRAKTLWRDVVAEFELRPDELEVLASACYAAQRASEIRKELAGMDILLPGSMGQLVANPLLSEVRNHESHVAAMLGKLKLKETESGVASTRSAGARAAAQKKWAVPHHGSTP